MLRYPSILIFLILLCQTSDGSPLTNNDIVELAQLGLSDDVQVAKVRQAPEVAFDLDIEDLRTLRDSGVTDAVITAMLERSSSPSQARPTGPTMPQSGFEQIAATLQTKDGELSLALKRGLLTSKGFGMFRLRFIDFPETHARIRTSDPRPAVVLSSNTHPQSHVFLVKLDSNPKDNDRSLKIGSMKAAFAREGTRLMEPDHDWTLSYTVVELGETSYRIEPDENLESGEYGLFIGYGRATASSGLFDFGVDP